MTKSWLAPDIAESIASGVPKSWLAPDLAQAIRSGVPAPWLEIGIAEDIVDAAGSSPEWVPANAKIYIDLIAPGRAWTETDGEVAIDTLLGADANTENGWATSLYDPSKLTADGYVTDGSNSPALIGSALAKALDTATIVVKTERVTDDSNNSALFVVMSADGNDAVQLNLNFNGAVAASSYGGSFTAAIANIVNTGDNAVNCAAITVTASRFDVAVNGNDAIAGTLASGDRPPGNPFVAAVIDPNENNALQSITIYDALPSTAGLSALSETGVTNTAPTAIVTEWLAPAVDGAIDIGFPGNQFILVVRSVTDAEGNPFTLSLTDDGDGIFSIIGETIVQMAIGEDFLGDYTFTLRATDPGGLYVEQEFTITVTA